MRPAPLLALLFACQGQTSHKSPTFTEEVKTTLFTSAVPCLEAVEVAAGGELVRRATGFGPLAVQRVNVRVAREGEAAPALSESLCPDLTSDHAKNPRDFENPPAPAVVRELAEMSGADSVLVPFVATDFRCDSSPTWRWGEPAYENETGRIDCHEATLVMGAFLYAADGSLVWKAVHHYELDESPDLAELSEALLREAPLGDPAPLRHQKTGIERDELEALDDIPERDVTPP